MRITWHAYAELFRLEFWLFRKDFPALHERVRRAPVADTTASLTPDCISQAMDLAAALYFKPVLCLQRSAALASLLRKHGYPAQMVIGVQHLPFRAHAWVELDGRIIGDKPYIREIYSELARC